MRTVHVIDSHTGGEPTRVVVDGFPDLGGGSLAERRERLRLHHDHWRRALACEPRGSDVLVGAVLVPPADPDACAGVIFFNNVGCLGMCGHGAIGVIRTLRHLGRIAPGRHRLDTPAGCIDALLEHDGTVTIDNVESWRSRRDVTLDVPGYGRVRGDVAWGGNWFFLTDRTWLPLDYAHRDRLTRYALAIRSALSAAGTCGDDGAEIDHIEISVPSPTPGIDARNFVLCPGGVYDRSPCGTGTSAKLACLAADGRLAPERIYRQESLVGSVFEASYRQGARGVLPRIRGRAYLTADARLLIDSDDPFAWGLDTALPQYARTA